MYNDYQLSFHQCFQSFSNSFGDQSPTVYTRYKEFQLSKIKFADSDCNCHPVTIATKQNVARVKCLIKEDPQDNLIQNEIKDILDHMEAYTGPSVTTWMYGSVATVGMVTKNKESTM